MYKVAYVTSVQNLLKVSGETIFKTFNTISRTVLMLAFCRNFDSQGLPVYGQVSILED